MTFTRSLATGNYGPAKFIVDGTTVANGTHSTIAAALTSASSGDTIFIRPGTYTENLTLKVGVNLTAFDCDAYTPNVTIVGNCTLSTAGTVSCSGIRFQTNSANCITVSGSVASILKLVNCFINCSNNTGISFTSSSADSEISLISCNGNIGTTGIAFFSMNTSGDLIFTNCYLTNSGGSTTASSIAGGSAYFLNCPFIGFPLSSSGSSTFEGTNTLFSTFFQDVVTFVANSSASHKASGCIFRSSTSAVLTVTNNLTLQMCCVQTSNTTPITGAGTITYGLISFDTFAPTISTTTQNETTTRYGVLASTKQPAFSAYLPSTDANVTGDASVYTFGGVTDLTEIFDQGGDFDNSTGIFTTPISGRFLFNGVAYMGGILSTHTNGYVQLTTSNRNYSSLTLAPSKVFNVSTNMQLDLTHIADMDVGDTAQFQVQMNNGTKVVDALGAASPDSVFSGYMLC